MAHPGTAAAGFKAVVTGGTGAIGQHIVGELLSSPKWAKVVTIGRRNVTVPAEYSLDQAQLEKTGRLEQHTIDMEKLGSADTASLFRGADAAFCTIGTTRSDAGGAEGFHHVDYDYVIAAAAASRKAGTPVFTHVTSSGADPDSWFLYLRTKGEAERDIRALEFPHTLLLRPGLLNRGDKVRFVERLALSVIGGIPVRTVARAARIHAEKVLEEHPSLANSGHTATKPSAPPEVKTLDDAAIYQLAQ